MPGIDIQSVIDVLKDEKVSPSVKEQVSKILLRALGGKTVIEIAEKEKGLFKFFTKGQILNKHMHIHNNNVKFEMIAGIMRVLPKGDDNELKIPISAFTKEQSDYLNLDKSFLK